MKSPAPFVMSWNLQYLGSYSCHKMTSESLCRKMEKINRLNYPSEFVFLSVSLEAIFVSPEDTPQEPLLVHPIRKICCVFGKIDTRQVLYVTKKVLDDGSSKKECHIFRTQIPQQVEEIESVMSSAFQRVMFVDNSIPFLPPSLPASPPSKPPSTVSSGSSQNPSETTISSSRSSTPPLKRSTTSIEPANVPLTSTPIRKRANMSATVLFQKFFRTPKTESKIVLDDSTDTPLRTPHNNNNRRRKRPVSAVLGNAIQKLSNHASSTLTPKKKPDQHSYSSSSTVPVDTPTAMYRDKKQAQQLSGILEKSSDSSNTDQKKEPALEFDDKLGEFVFPIGEFMDDQLQRLAYFCKNPNRDEVYSVLHQMPEGAFILRYSESRRKCLALTVRIPEDDDGLRIAHYLIIRNEEGFRIKGAQRYFKSLPMLITHYTILPELLPCRLIFVEWDRTLLRGRPRVTPIQISLDDHCGKSYQQMNIIELNQSPRKKFPRQNIELCQF